jgi:mitotic spindle assembly checkpoint protein MAD2B
VSIVILSENWQPLERFGFNVSSFPKVSEEHREEEWWRYNKTNEGGKAMKMPLAELYEQFRAVVMQMSVCSGKLGKLPENCTWTVSLELMEGTEAPPKDVSVFSMRSHDCLSY